MLNLSSFRLIYFEGFILSLVNQFRTVMASVHSINVLNLPSNTFKAITAMRAPSKMAINYFLGMYHVSAFRGTTLLLASINEEQFPFTK